MRHYCSLADSAYLYRALTLHDSLLRQSSEEFLFWFLPIDDEALRIVLMLQPKHMIPVRMNDFVQIMGLEEVRDNRSYQEWCWTCASQLSEYLMRFYNLDEITYLDADTFLFSDPSPIFEEVRRYSIAVTPHRLIPSKQHLERNGRFNVGWITFKNDREGRDALYTWAAQCRDRCSATIGCGDQRYLDDLDSRYGLAALCIIENIGVNAGPWSVGNWKVTEGPRLDGVPLIHFHFHELMPHADGTFFLTGYDLRDEDRRFIYEPYLQAYKRIGFHVEQMKEERCH